MSSLITTLHQALEDAGRVLMAHYGRLDTIEKKGDIDLVTVADRASEDCIKSVVLAKYPDHAILAEEGGEIPGSEYQWVIDPLDGTTNFAHGFPLFSISIAVLLNGKPVAAGVLNPYYRECFLAEKGAGATLNGTPIHVSKNRLLSESLIVSGFPYDRRERLDHYLAGWKEMLQRAQGVLRLGSAALDLCAVACGRLDAFWEEKLKSWDTAAGWLIVQEAGGLVTDFANQPFTAGGPHILASNGLIHGECIQALSVLGPQ
jgi:myo-inositol-1(or 4)-monophosphatase